MTTSISIQFYTYLYLVHPRPPSTWASNIRLTSAYHSSGVFLVLNCPRLFNREIGHPWWLWAPLRGPLVPFWKPYRATAVNSWCASCTSSWKWHRLRAYLFFDQAVPCCTLPSSLEVVLLAWMIVGTLQLSGFKHEFTRSGWSPPRVDATSLHTTYTFTWSLVMAWTKHTCRAYFTQQFHIQ